MTSGHGAAGPLLHSYSRCPPFQSLMPVGFMLSSLRCT